MSLFSKALVKLPIKHYQCYWQQERVTVFPPGEPVFASVFRHFNSLGTRMLSWLLSGPGSSPCCGFCPSSPFYLRASLPQLSFSLHSYWNLPVQQIFPISIQACYYILHLKFKNLTYTYPSSSHPISLFPFRTKIPLFCFYSVSNLSLFTHQASLPTSLKPCMSNSW